MGQAHIAEARVVHWAQIDAVVGRAGNQGIARSVVVQHIGRCDRAAAAAEHWETLAAAVVVVSLGYRERPGVEAAIHQEVVIGDDERIQVHAQLREVGEITHDLR